MIDSQGRVDIFTPYDVETGMHYEGYEGAGEITNGYVELDDYKRVVIALKNLLQMFDGEYQDDSVQEAIKIIPEKYR